MSSCVVRLLVGRLSSSSRCRRDLPPRKRRALVAVHDRLPGDQLGHGDDRERDRERQRGGQRDHADRDLAARRRQRSCGPGAACAGAVDTHRGVGGGQLAGRPAPEVGALPSGRRVGIRFGLRAARRLLDAEARGGSAGGKRAVRSLVSTRPMRSVGRCSSSLTSATITGVSAAAIQVPANQSWDVTSAAQAAAVLAIASVRTFSRRSCSRSLCGDCEGMPAHQGSERSDGCRGDAAAAGGAVERAR